MDVKYLEKLKYRLTSQDVTEATVRKRLQMEEPDVKLEPVAHAKWTKELEQAKEAHAESRMSILSDKNAFRDYAAELIKAQRVEGFPVAMATVRQMLEQLTDFNTEGSSMLVSVGSLAPIDSKSLVAGRYDTFAEYVRLVDTHVLVEDAAGFYAIKSRVYQYSVGNVPSFHQQMEGLAKDCGAYLVWDSKANFIDVKMFFHQEISSMFGRITVGGSTGHTSGQNNYSGRPTMSEYPKFVAVRKADGTSNEEAYHEYQYAVYKVHIRNLGRANVTGSFTEFNIQQATKFNSSIREKWENFSASKMQQGGAWDTTSEHIKIKEFIEKELKLCNRRQIYKVAERDFMALDYYKSKLSIAEFLEVFEDLSNVLERLSSSFGAPDERVSTPAARIKQLCRKISPSCLLFVQDHCAAQRRTYKDDRYLSGYPLSMEEMKEVCGDWAESREFKGLDQLEDSFNPSHAKTHDADKQGRFKQKLAKASGAKVKGSAEFFSAELDKVRKELKELRSVQTSGKLPPKPSPKVFKSCHEIDPRNFAEGEGTVPPLLDESKHGKVIPKPTEPGRNGKPKPYRLCLAHFNGKKCRFGKECMYIHLSAKQARFVERVLSVRPPLLDAVKVVGAHRAKIA